MPFQGSIKIPSWFVISIFLWLWVDFRKGELGSEENSLHAHEFSSCEFYIITTTDHVNNSLKKAERSSVHGIHWWHLSEYALAVSWTCAFIRTIAATGNCIKISSNNFDLNVHRTIPAGHINFFASNKISIEKFGIALLKWVSTEYPQFNSFL